MVSTPADKPVTTPVLIFMDALVLLTLQLPEGVASLKVIVEDTHTFAGPVIACGNGFTVIVADAKQVPMAYSRPVFPPLIP